MPEMKYVVVKAAIGDLEVPIILSPALSHKDVCHYEAGAWTFNGRPVVSAGFVSLYPNDKTDAIAVSCYGRSVTLGLGSRPKDSEILNYSINNTQE